MKNESEAWDSLSKKNFVWIIDERSTDHSRNKRILQNANFSAIPSSMQAISFRDRSVSHDTAVHGIPFMQPAVKREYVSVRPRRKDAIPDKTIKIIALMHLVNPNKDLLSNAINKKID